MSTKAASLSTPIAQNYTTIATVPGDGDDHYWFFLSNGFVRCANGTLIAAAPIAKKMTDTLEDANLDATVTVHRSTNNGASWQRCINVYFEQRVEVALFSHGNDVYMIVGIYDEAGSIAILHSADDGVTWSEPVTVARNPNPDGQWYCLHGTSMAVQNDTLYFAVSEHCKHMAMLTCDLRQDPCSPTAWRLGYSVEMPIPAELDIGWKPGFPMRCLEGNTIIVDGELRVMARACIDSYSITNLAAIYDVDDAGDLPKLTFRQYYPLPGGNCKFFICHDAASNLYWMVSNLPANSQTPLEGMPHRLPGNDRRFLWLWYARDGLNWFPAACLARAGENECFMYPSMAIDGDDLVILCRTCHAVTGKQAAARALRGDHDANRLTFHRVRGFRGLAMPL